MNERPKGGGGGDTPIVTIVFVVIGTLFNLLALVMLFVNIVRFWQAWLTGAPVTFGWDLLTPLGAFLIGVICYLIAHSLDN